MTCAHGGPVPLKGFATSYRMGSPILPPTGLFWTRSIGPPPVNRWANPRIWPDGQGGSMKALWQAFSSDESGQGLVEYALILVLVAVVVIVILALLGPAIGNVFSNIVNNI